MNKQKKLLDKLWLDSHVTNLHANSLTVNQENLLETLVSKAKNLNHNKKLLYFSCHNTMECNELEVFSNLGFTCVTLGNFTKGKLVKVDGNQWYWTLHDWRLPKYKKDEVLTAKFLEMNPEFLGISTSSYNLTKDFISQFEVIVVSNVCQHLKDVVRLSSPDQLIIWCSVGQINPDVESFISEFRSRITIIRCAITESVMPNFCGVDYYITASVDPSFFVNWIGDVAQAITVTRAIGARGDLINFPTMLNITSGLPFKVYGKGNESLGNVAFNGGELSFENLIKCYQHNRVFICGGSCPAPLTYTFMEAMAAGIPIICMGPNLVRLAGNLFNMDKYINNGENGFVSDDINELRTYCELLLSDYDLAKKISKNATEFAKKTWSANVIQKKWEKVFQDKGIM